MRVGRTLIALGAVALISVAAGCGSDSSGETTAPTVVSVPPPTSPIPTAPTTTAPAGGGKKKKPRPTTTPTVASGPCSVPDAYGRFRYTGIDCTGAVAVATAWDQDGKDCNTVDNPNVAEGYHRTCSVEGFTCTARRDVHSDARFVSCTQGGQSIRFTWLPA